MLNEASQAPFMWFTESLLLNVGDSASSCRHWRNGALHTVAKKGKKKGGGGSVTGNGTLFPAALLFPSNPLRRCAPFRLAATRNRKHHGFPNPIVLTKKGVSDWPNGISFAPGQGIGEPPCSERAESPTECHENTPTAATKKSLRNLKWL